jgi:hypothetical protein
MRLSHCESHCAGSFRFIPCLPKSKDASADAASAPAAVAEEEGEAPPVQKIEVPVDGKDGDEEEREDGEKAAVATAAAPKKSCLKKANCGDGKCAAKGNVQWLDLLGKDLTEVKEYEPRYANLPL